MNKTLTELRLTRDRLLNDLAELDTPTKPKGTLERVARNPEPEKRFLVPTSAIVEADHDFEFNVFVRACQRVADAEQREYHRLLRSAC